MADSSGRTAAAPVSPAQSPGPTGITVAVCTFRRNALLRQVVPLLLAQADSLDRSRYRAEVLVIDNNPDGDAGPVVAALREQAEAVQGAAPLHYVHQPRPGLSAARNAALERAAGSLLAFIDVGNADDPAPCTPTSATQPTPQPTTQPTAATPR